MRNTNEFHAARNARKPGDDDGVVDVGYQSDCCIRINDDDRCHSGFPDDRRNAGLVPAGGKAVVLHEKANVAVGVRPGLDRLARDLYGHRQEPDLRGKELAPSALRVFRGGGGSFHHVIHRVNRRIMSIEKTGDGTLASPGKQPVGGLGEEGKSERLLAGGIGHDRAGEDVEGGR